MEFGNFTGPTIMVMKYDKGVIIGADARTNMGFYVDNHVTDRLIHVVDKIYCCRSGSTIDTEALADRVRHALCSHQNRTGEKPTVYMAVQYFRNYCYNYHDSLLSGIIVAGWDNRKGGQVYTVHQEGMSKVAGIAVDGSGTPHAYDFIRQYYLPAFTKEFCIEFVKRTIKHTIYCDGNSRGVIRVGIINKRTNDIKCKVFYDNDI